VDTLKEGVDPSREGVDTLKEGVEPSREAAAPFA